GGAGAHQEVLQRGIRRHSGDRASTVRPGRHQSISALRVRLPRVPAKRSTRTPASGPGVLDRRHRTQAWRTFGAARLTDFHPSHLRNQEGVQMRIRVSALVVGVLVSTALVATGQPLPRAAQNPATQKVSPAKSLYERLGGVYPIAVVVDDFIERLLV